MTAFSDASAIESSAMRLVLPWIKRAYPRYVLTQKGRLAVELQRSVGDALVNATDGRILGLEVKAEQVDRYGNLFLETWSNRERFTPGWMITLNADVLLYCFIDTRMLYAMDFQELKQWAFWKGRIYAFPEKRQSAYSQINDTWGRCAPIATLRSEIRVLEIPLADAANTVMTGA